MIDTKRCSPQIDESLGISDGRVNGKNFLINQNGRQAFGRYYVENLGITAFESKRITRVAIRLLII